MIDPNAFHEPGTPENMLVRAGLIELFFRNEQPRIRLTPVIQSMFPDEVPDLDRLVPPLLELVRAQTMDKSSILEIREIRANAIQTLQRSGFEPGENDENIPTLIQAIEKCCKQSHTERSVTSGGGSERVPPL